jgi:hypothetical protein
MFLLAGLYKGQLARVKESMSWIAMADRVTQTLLDRHKLYNDNYWTAYRDVRRQHEKGQKLITVIIPPSVNHSWQIKVALYRLIKRNFFAIVPAFEKAFAEMKIVSA